MLPLNLMDYTRYSSQHSKVKCFNVSHEAKSRHWITNWTLINLQKLPRKLPNKSRNIGNYHKLCSQTRTWEWNHFLYISYIAFIVSFSNEKQNNHRAYNITDGYDHWLLWFPSITNNNHQHSWDRLNRRKKNVVLAFE